MKNWFTTAELASFSLIGLPPKQNRIAELAKAQKWNERINAMGEPLARKRQSRGGGYEYHIDLLPLASLNDLKTRFEKHSKKVFNDENRTDWAWFEAQNSKVKEEAFGRLCAINSIENHRQTMTLNRAIELTALAHNVSIPTLWNWWALIDGVGLNDRIVALAPRRKGGGKKTEIHPDDWQFFKSDYLRPTPTTYSGCFERTQEFARNNGRKLAHVKTFIRRLEAEVPKDVLVLKRQGVKALKELIPAQQRSVAHMHALEMVNIDGHKWDVFVKFPSENGQKERIGRPISVVIQDIYSRKILAWRTGESENVVLTRLAFADVFKNYGIPKSCLLDNGRAFASKMITGGAKTRFRFKIRDEDPLGLLTALGIKTHWATPGHGQAKPIERAFRDLEDRISKHPMCEGAYTGNHINAQPENYGERAIPLADFEKLIAEQIAIHNARMGRKTETANGDSFDNVFAASYAANPIGRASPEQLRLALLGADQIRTDRKNGAIMFAETRYWCRELMAIAGEIVTIRFDPDDFHSEIFVYKNSGEFIAEIKPDEAPKFNDLAEAKAQAKMVSSAVKLARQASEAQDLLKANELARLLKRPDPAQDLTPTPNIIRPIRMRGTNAAQKIQNEQFSNQFGAAISALREDRANNPQILRVFEGGLAPKSGGDAK